VNENKIKVKDLNHAVDLTQNIDNMKKEKSQLEYDIDTLMDLKKYYEAELDEIKRKYYKIR
jgi:predicted  nucleic acid-binding Zn-ribbon protein